MNETTILTCKRCPGEKTSEDFYKAPRNRNGLEKVCKKCWSVKVEVKKKRVVREFVDREQITSTYYCLFVGSGDPLLPYFKN